MKNLTLVHRAFYAQAVADAIGERFEFYTASNKEVRKLMQSKEKLYISDDTQMALFGQEAINEMDLNGHVDLTQAQIVIEDAYLEWYETQIRDREPQDNSGLLSFHEMFARRAPGSQCMAALGQLWRSNSASTINGKGCGSVMRLLPFAGLLVDEGKPLATVRELALISANVTHSHPESDDAVVRYIEAAALLLEGVDRKHIGMGGKRITDHGLGWVASECVDMALWALERARDYDHLLELTICHNGDSDSIAAVAGSLWGLAGLGGWERYVTRLEEKEAIDSLFSE